MEEKALKTGVYVNETILNELLETPIDVDFTLPDYCGDISKIFKGFAIIRNEKTTQKNKIVNKNPK